MINKKGLFLFLLLIIALLFYVFKANTVEEVYPFNQSHISELENYQSLPKNVEETKIESIKSPAE